MKNFEYVWDDDYYLLHLQLTAGHTKGMTATVKRVFADARPSAPELFAVPEGATSHRIMLCRTHPAEQRFNVEFPAEAKLEIFRLDDRAYYPTEVYRTA